MATATYTPIASQTLTSSASSVTFSSIPQNYRDLVLVVNPSITTSVDILRVEVNSDTSSSYSNVVMAGNGSSASSGSLTTTSFRVTWNNYNLSTEPSSGIFQFLDYSQTDKHKSVLSRTNLAGTNGGTYAAASRWANTSAISSLRVFAENASTFTAGSTFSLYGIAA